MDASPRTDPARASQALDLVGASASVACAIHCAIVALVLGLMPAMSFLAAPWVEWGFLAVSVAVGLAALVPGFRRHRQRAPLVLFALGIALLLAPRLADDQASPRELLVVCMAAIALVTAHWQNRGALHRCACGPAHHA